MDLAFSAPAEEQALAEAREPDALEAALRGVLRLQNRLGDPALHGRKLFCAGLDALVPVLAGRLGLLDKPASSQAGDDVLIVATQFYAVGGHTRVAEDISTLHGRDRVVALLTDAFGKMRHRQLLGGIGGRERLWQRSLLLLGARTATERILELYSLVAALRPSRIFLLAHHMDIVAAVGLWPFRDVVEFVHHANYLPSIGATLPFSRHADLSSICNRACTDQGLAPVYAGMTVQLPEIMSARQPFSTPGRIRIATCGSRNKYHGRRRFAWGDYAVAALGQEGAELLHFGPVDDEIRAGVAAALAAAGIAPHRYVYAGSVRSIAGALASHEVDLFLSSYPESGSKAALEAMAMGYEPIVPMDPDLPPLLRTDFADPDWIAIGSPAELAEAIARTRARDAPAIAAQVARVRALELGRFEAYVRGG